MDHHRILLLLFCFLLPCHGINLTAVQGSQFGKGRIELAGIELREHFTFTKILTAGPVLSGDSAATFFSPSSLPAGFFPLGSHAQLHTANPSPPRSLIVRQISATSLPFPDDFTLLFSANSSAFFWLPVPPPGYSAAGHLVTASPHKPPLSSLLCLPNHLLQPCRAESPSLGTFRAAKTPPLCINNTLLTLAAAPNFTQITALIQTHAPIFHFHPKEPYLPSSVSWFFNNGALLFTNSSPNNPTSIDRYGDDLPRGGADDGAYWLDLPVGAASQSIVKAGNLSSAEAYVHVKPALGGAATDIVFWLFYPFNGPARVRVEFLDIALGRIGEHVGDWEHVTQRFSNFDGELKRMYFSQHSSGEWVEAAELEYEAGGKQPAAYATLHGHAFYGKAGIVLKGGVGDGIGAMDETAAGGAAASAAAMAAVVSAEYLGVEEPAWLQYMREWGPKVSYDEGEELEKAIRVLPEKMKGEVRDLVSRLPKELLGEEGPTGPKEKASWNGDES